MSIEPTIAGWQSVKSKLASVIRIANQIKNARITRGGSQDTITFSGNSMTIKLAEFPRKGAPGGGGESAESIHSFKLIPVGLNELYVVKGTIGSIVPKINGIQLEVDYTENELSLPGTGIMEYWLNITVDNGSPTDAEIVNSEPSGDTATQSKLLLGTVEVDSGEIVALNSNLSGSQSFASCGSIYFFSSI